MIEWAFDEFQHVFMEEPEKYMSTPYLMLWVRF